MPQLNIRRAFILYSLVVVTGSVTYFFEDVKKGFATSTHEYHTDRFNQASQEFHTCYKEVLGSAFNSVSTACRDKVEAECRRGGVHDGMLFSSCEVSFLFQNSSLYACLEQFNTTGRTCFSIVSANAPESSGLTGDLLRFAKGIYSRALWTGLLSILLGVAAFPLFFVLKRWLFSGAKNKKSGE